MGFQKMRGHVSLDMTLKNIHVLTLFHSHYRCEGRNLMCHVTLSRMIPTGLKCKAKKEICGVIRKCLYILS